MYKFIKPKIISHVKKLYCSFEHFPGVYMYFWMWRMSVNAAKGTFLIFLFLCAFFMTSFHSSSIVAFSSVIIIAWNERSFVLLGFPRHASLRDRSPESFEPYVTLDSSKFAGQNNVRSSYSFLPKFSLESIPYSPDWVFTWRIFVSQVRCAARRDNMCLLSPSKKFRWRAFLRSFHGNEFLRKVVRKYRIPSCPCNIKKIEFDFASDVLAFLHSSSRIVYFFSEEFRSIYKSCEIRNDSSLSKLHFSVQYDDDKWISFRASAWAQQSILIPSSSFHIFRSKLFPIAVRFSAEILSPYGGFPSQSGFLEFVVSSW